MEWTIEKSNAIAYGRGGCIPLPDDSLEKWEYKEHTKVKHEILGKYLNGWARILGKFHDLNVFDCFAGRGTYQDGEEGSPFIIIKSIAEVREKMGRPNEASCIFIEKNENNFKNLQDQIQSLCKQHRDWLDVEFYNDEFANVAKETLENYGDMLAPSFFFVDPFGWGGVPFETIKEILALDKSEVFITFMVRDLNRFIENDPHKISIEELYGINNVAEVISQQYSVMPREQALLKLYRDRLHQKANVKYSFPFKLNADERLETTYYLIHCTNHPLGCELMKEIMYGSGTEGRFGYLGPAEGQMILQQFEGEGRLMSFLLDRFRGRRLRYKDVRYETLMEANYSVKSYRKAIVELEEEGKIEILGKGPRGGLPDDAIIVFP